MTTGRINQVAALTPPKPISTPAPFCRARLNARLNSAETPTGSSGDPPGPACSTQMIKGQMFYISFARPARRASPPHTRNMEEAMRRRRPGLASRPSLTKVPPEYAQGEPEQHTQTLPGRALPPCVPSREPPTAASQQILGAVHRQ